MCDGPNPEKIMHTGYWPQALLSETVPVVVGLNVALHRPAIADHRPLPFVRCFHHSGPIYGRQIGV